MVEGEAGRRTGSMIPPVARRKLMMRELNSRREARRNVLAGSLVALFIIIFVVYNIQYIRDLKTKRQVFEGSRAGDTVSVASSTNADNSGRLRGTHSWISAHSQPFNLNDSATNAKHLIMVAGHSVTVSGHLEDAGKDEGDWFLLSYQKGKGLPQAIEGHIRAGIEEANKDPESLLVFSGGETRPITGPLSEGSSYFHVSDAMGLWPTGSTVRARTVSLQRYLNGLGCNFASCNLLIMFLHLCFLIFRSPKSLLQIALKTCTFHSFAGKDKDAIHARHSRQLYKS